MASAACCLIPPVIIANHVPDACEELGRVGRLIFPRSIQAVGIQQGF